MNKVRNAFNIITIAVVSIDILFRNKLPLVIRNNSWKKGIKPAQSAQQMWAIAKSLQTL